MLLRGVDFGYCWDQSGVRNFFGNGYPYHRYLKPIGLSFLGSTFVAKTTTLEARTGNMQLGPDLMPQEFMPKCIVINLPDGYALNAVGLSGPGADALLVDGRWQIRTKPFMISFMSVAKTAEWRLVELRGFVNLLRMYLSGFRAPIALQINFTCPNVEVVHADDQMADEVIEANKIASVLGIPIVDKINIETSMTTLSRIAQDPNCDAICCSNTVKWGNLPHLIDWKSLFDKTGVSPLAHFGGGGLSGRPLFPLVLDWLKRARTEAQITKPINVGGGILGSHDVEQLVQAGASSVALGSIAFLRPWRVRTAINRANTLGRAGKFYQV